MAVINRRLIFWLIKAYIKRWGKVILLSFLVGLAIFFILKQFLFATIVNLASQNKETIGVVGAYTVNTLPESILSHLSQGLTTVGDDGIPHPGLATSWHITQDGKTYQFNLKKGVKFTDGTPFTSSQVNVSYSDVKVDRPNDFTIIFHLKESYAPFLVTLSKPIFRKNFIGTGPYVLSSIKLNSSFVESLSFKSTDGLLTRVYQFYPTQDALKVAYALGEVSSARGLNSETFQNTTLEKFANTKVSKSVNYEQLIALFYNTQNQNLSDKQLRDAISYTIPNTFTQGERAYTSISPLSWAYSSLNQRPQDFAHGQVLLDAAGGTKNLPVFTLDTLPKYESVAKIVQKSIAKIGIKTKLVVVDTIPENFQMFIGDFMVSKDPDQYTLWHSFQSNNITNFNTDKRIDKLLEDGRQTVDQGQRQQIYSDFQKYLTDEQPATFLYFPYNYTVTRK